ncbi:MAG: hypothetical protein RL240_3324, partial [Planctomycetota bacterium]
MTISNMTVIPSKLLPYALATPYTKAEWIEEPLLLFGRGKHHEDPKTGIPLYGPKSFGTARHKPVVHAGFIGTVNSMNNARTFLAKCSDGINGDHDQAPFPGCSENVGYRFKLVMPNELMEPINRQEERDLAENKSLSKRERFELLVGLL